MSYKIYFGGSCVPINPGGVMGIGGYITDEYDNWIFSYSDWVDTHPSNTNNKAEVFSAYMGLSWLFDNYKDNLENISVVIYGDSAIVCKKMNKKVNTFTGEYSKIAENLFFLAKNSFKDVKFVWIPREENEIANELSIQTLCQNNLDLCK